MNCGSPQQPLGKSRRPDNWSVASDPAVIATLPVAALLYRQGHLRLVEKTYALRLAPELRTGRKISPEISAPIRTIYEPSRLVTKMPAVAELPWFTPRPALSGTIIIDDRERSFPDPAITLDTAGTGEFSRDFLAGHFRIDTAQSKVIAGTIGGLNADPGCVSARIDQSTAYCGAKPRQRADRAVRQFADYRHREDRSCG